MGLKDDGEHLDWNLSAFLRKTLQTLNGTKFDFDGVLISRNDNKMKFSMLLGTPSLFALPEVDLPLDV